MGEFTSTNEEMLVNLISKLERYELIILLPGDNWIDIYVVPSSIDLNYLETEEERKPYWKGAVSAIALHSGVWTGSLARAARYR